jgi:hypothetical protein
MGDLLLGLLLGFGVGVAATAAVFLRARRPPSPAAPPAPPPADPAGKALLDSMLQEADAATDLRQNLRLKFLYDEEKIEEAIAYERQRQPEASQEELMRAAITRWERENR